MSSSSMKLKKEMLYYWYMYEDKDYFVYTKTNDKECKKLTNGTDQKETICSFIQSFFPTCFILI